MRARPLLLVPEWARRWLVPAAAGIAVAAVMALLVPAVLPAVAAGLVAAGVATALQMADPDESRLPLANEELHRLIAEVAAELGLRRPGRVCAWARPDSLAVRVTPWRDELRLGLPFLTEMRRDELRAVVAYELTLLALRRSLLTDALHTWWMTDLPRGRPVPPEVEDVLIGMFRSADAAAARVAGVPASTSALLRGALISNSFTWFAVRYGGPAAELHGFPTDLYAGWRWKGRHDGLLTAFARSVAEDDRPGSTPMRIAALTGETPTDVAAKIAADGIGTRAGSAGSAVLPEGLPEEDERRLARAFMRELLARPAARGVPLREVPDRLWDGVLEQERTDVLAVVAALLGREDATSEDVVDVARAGRADELAWDHRAWLCPHRDPAVCALFPVLHRELRESGHAYANPLARRVLIAPDGARVDVAALAAEVATGT
ncbi:hypothetical protein EDD27_8291 [Nonomuraea polychroma]|uniref:Zn-dependent protease with chaperone function n=2 Tax=Nonomuraea polychroma TaxID=46176 RepID=A0A438MI46_9ACTN|nr:hypothetical protein EDD27_8291 [Nonomuraea polychroma]